MTETVLTDRMKTVLLDQTGGELHFHKKFLEFAADYGFVPRVYRPETNTQCERFMKTLKWQEVYRTDYRDWPEAQEAEPALPVADDEDEPRGHDDPIERCHPENARANR